MLYHLEGGLFQSVYGIYHTYAHDKHT